MPNLPPKSALATPQDRTGGMWFRMYDAALYDIAVQRLPPDEFRAAFFAAIAGEETPFSRFIRGPFVRPEGAEWAAIRTRIFERDDYTCTYCGARGGKLECDHIVPVSRGGRHEDYNLATACFSCNRSKRNKLVSEWLK